MKGKFLRNLKLIPTITNLNQGLVLHLNPPQVFCLKENPIPTPSIYQVHGIESDHHEEEEEEIDYTSNKDKTTPTVVSKETEQTEERVLPKYPSLTDYEELCPPGGSNTIILYTTSMRGIRKTFQDCNTIKFLLRSFRVKYHERDMSLHSEYREELWKILGGKVIPPKLFIKGRYIGGADQVVGLHEMGWLGKLLEGTPTDSTECSCVGCDNMRFAICSNCNGSRKIFITSSNEENDDHDEDFFIRCPECNENGLVKCPICSRY